MDIKQRKQNFEQLQTPTMGSNDKQKVNKATEPPKELFESFFCAKNKGADQLPCARFDQ